MARASLRNGLVAALVLGLAGCGADPSPLVDNADQQSSDHDDVDDNVRPPAKDAAREPARDAGVKRDAVAPAPGKTTDAAPGSVAKGAEGVPCDVAAVLAKRCATCHGAEPAFGAPMPLVTLADFAAESTKGPAMFELTKARINEPDPRRAMPPSTGVKLSTGELATLNRWLSAGAHGTTESCVPPEHADVTGSSRGAEADDKLSTEDLDCYKLVAFGGGTNQQYKVGTAVDKYVNFTFRSPWPTTAYGMRFSPIISNRKALHHFLIFQDSSNKAPGSSASSGAHPDGQLVYGWAPGGRPLDLREETDVSVGFELPSTTSYTLEMHYNSNDPSAEDASGVEVCVARSKPDNIANITWLGYDQLLVPAAKWTGTCVPENTVPVHILGVQPHMHVAGTHMKTVIHRKGGGDEVLHDEPFDFNDQRHYLKNVTINPGDTLTTECTFDKPMAFGESTGQEMCYNFAFAYPKGQLKDSGPWGSVSHGGSACLGQ